LEAHGLFFKYLYRKPMLRKITRIFLKSLSVLLLFVIFTGVFLFFGIQTYAFQTWLGKRAGSYLSSEFGSKVQIQKVNIEFFSKANLNGLIILDKHQDTIFSGDLLLDIKNFNYKKQTLLLKNITLNNVTAKLIKYRGDSIFNYTYLVNYFDTGTKDTSSKKGWDVKFGEVNLNDVAFVYKREEFAGQITQNINFDAIALKHTYGNLSGLKFEHGIISAEIKKLRTEEQSGFRLLELSTNATVSDTRLVCKGVYLKTPRSFVKGKIDFSYSKFEDFSDFINRIKMDCKLEDSTYVHFDDIAAFASELNELKKTVNISGEVKGFVNDMTMKHCILAYGSDTKFIGDLALKGLPDIDSTSVNLNAQLLTTSVRDIESVPDYPFSDNRHFQMPVEIKKLGTIKYQGTFNRFKNDFQVFGKFKTGLGNVSTKITLKTGAKIDDISYHGFIATDNFDLGTLVGLGDLNALTVNTEIEGQGLSLKSLRAYFHGQVLSLMYNGYVYKDIVLDGNISGKLFKGELVSKDPNADFDFNGTVDFKNKVPEMDFISTINKVDLNALKIISSKDSGRISSQVFIEIRGNNIDNLSGQINFDNTIYTTSAKTFTLSSFNVDMDQGNLDKRIKLTSAYLNAGIKGRYQLSNLKAAVQVFLFNYYPTFFRKPVKNTKFTDDLTFKIKIKKYNTINELFTPELMLSPETTVEGNFNTIENKLNIQANAAKVSYKDFSVNDLGLIINENGNTVLAEVSGKAINLDDSVLIEHFNFFVNSIDKDSKFGFDWDNLKSPAYKGELKGQLNFNNTSAFLSLDKLLATIDDNSWRLTQANTISLDKGSSLTVNPIEILNKQQKIKISGTLSEKAGDSLMIETSGIVLQQFNPLLKAIKLNLLGELNGSVVLSNTNKNFAFRGDLNMTQLKINDNTIGAVDVKTTYNTREKSIALNGFTSLGIAIDPGSPVKNISFKGNYYLDKRAESIDVDFEARPANLRLLNPLLTDILTINYAFVNGEGKVHGTPDNIKIDGKFRLSNAEIKVDYTNVTYKVTGDIEVFPDQIRFSDLILRPSERGKVSVPQGTVNGNIFHSNFTRIQLDYDITYKNMLVLNTTEKENSTFYGKLYGTGNVGIYGLTNNLNMVIIDTTAKNSKFFLPLDGPAEISEHNFISFVKKDTVKLIKKKSMSGFNLETNLHITPDAQAQIILDKKTGDVLNAQGKGDINLKINTLGKFEMFGQYVISNGNYLFTLENVISKKFEIDAGSSIQWSGDPLKAEIDVGTRYKQRASISPLLLNDSSKSRVPVDIKLKITGKLFSPAIKIAIDFPNLDATYKAKIDNVLSDEAELNRQVFSFLLFRSFVTPLIYNATGGVTAGNAAASTGTELLSNRVSEFLNTYVGNLTGIRDLQLGLNYRPGSLRSNEAVDLALSKQFLNNKITVDGNFGVNNSTQTKNSSGLIGDVNIDYKLSPDGRYRLKGFNRSNDITQIATAGGQYTQGVGIFYREEFETFDQLFKRYLRNVKKK